VVCFLILRSFSRSAVVNLIDLFKPIWNSEVGICCGFGKHGDDPGTRANLRSPWDMLYPGCDWAHRDRRMRDAKPLAQIIGEIANHLAKMRATRHPVRHLVNLCRTGHSAGDGCRLRFSGAKPLGNCYVDFEKAVRVRSLLVGRRQHPGGLKADGCFR